MSNTSTRKNDQSDLPEYTALLASNGEPSAQETLHLSPKIKATDIPQWRWSQVQCREWLAKVLGTYLNFTKREAEAKAQEFVGFGPVLFMMNREAWWEWLGGQVGEGVYALVLEGK